MVNVWDRPPTYYGLKGRDTIHTVHTAVRHTVCARVLYCNEDVYTEIYYQLVELSEIVSLSLSLSLTLLLRRTVR